MTRDEFTQTMDWFTRQELVKAFKTETPTQWVFELYARPDRSRTQMVTVRLGDDGTLAAFSTIGDCPADAAVLQGLLRQNIEGFYSRLAVSGGDLVQVYRHPVGELIPLEMAKGLSEVARLADVTEARFFGGADET